MRLYQAGVCGTVALLDADLTPIQGTWLACAREILLMFNGDETGRRASRAIAQPLSFDLRVHVHHFPEPPTRRVCGDPCV